MKCCLLRKLPMNTFRCLDPCATLIITLRLIINLMKGRIFWVIDVLKKGGKCTMLKASKCLCLRMWCFMSIFSRGLIFNNDVFHISSFGVDPFYNKSHFWPNICFQRAQHGLLLFLLLGKVWSKIIPCQPKMVCRLLPIRI